jgi:uncharacterized SAM-binding protein YcdF (DUF218 family)
MNLRPRQWGCALVGLALLVLIGIPAAYLLLRIAGQYLIVSDPLQKVNAVVVLSGGSSERLTQAAELVLAKKAEFLIITDTGQKTADGKLLSDSVRMDAVLAGVSTHQILLTERVVDSTYEEAKATRTMMSIHHLSSCIVVTDSFHTRRTQIIFRDVFKGTGNTVLIYPTQDAWYKSGNWFLSLAGWSNTVREYAKLIYYVIFRAGK